jgi:hypothetical protein
LDRDKEKRELILFSQIVHEEKKEGGVMKKRRFLILFLIAGLIITMTCSSVVAEEFNVFGRPLFLFGYATQGGSVGLKDKYDTEKGLNSALMNLVVEGDYQIAKDLKFYGSGMLTVDWIYQLKHSDNSWNEKLFSKSKGKLNVDDKYWQLLKEARLTWTPGDFMFRGGKQIVSWGELLAFRIMDQINPLDSRRGFLDIEFETTIIPIWLLRADYYPRLNLSWLQDLGLEFVYNPNADFIPNQDLMAGNAEGGIWAPNVPIPGAYLATAYSNISTPKRWKEGNEFAFRVKANMLGSMVTLNGFYGRDNSPVALAVPPYMSPVPPHIFAPNGNVLLHPFSEGKYPLLKFVGATIAKEITPLRASFLGDVAPTVYLEALYAFDSTFAFTNPIVPVIQRFGKSDDLRTGIEVAWKVKIPALNARTYFNITGEFFYRKIMDYPNIETIAGLKKNNYQTFLSVSTSYFHNKLTPSFTWIHDINSNSNYFIPKLVYDHDYHWHFTLGGQLFKGAKEGQGLQLFDNKNQIFFKVAYKWG